MNMVGLSEVTASAHSFVPTLASATESTRIPSIEGIAATPFAALENLTGIEGVSPASSYNNEWLKTSRIQRTPAMEVNVIAFY
ncbi:MAG: hypothetical protein LBS36_01835 [Oscillospiraceae bacterium]|jgi:hypothetical protein|nr:hypothetical protein [Oscillospiraceae bacterium]